ncbi:MAG: molybdopterin-guanine dinucleotide biosynthesis protein B [Candidatus Heimdallarchaeota archaeon]|nr:molybdopterin-guanine dinucleotide biosynthesis protein B [Candidatus Heimdallarchaeota archaeon]MCK4768856.1 molybdopterin-guanine dinucleotide biosynthesis protein B [Candidatus Heimdallarchaeota archaeon]
MKDSQILQVVGYSQSGKTALIAKLIEEMSERNISILSLKSARQHEYTFSDKDSDVFSQKGSAISVVAFKNTIQIFMKKEREIMDVIDHLTNSFKIDLILIEGFKEENFTKIVIWTNEMVEEIDTFNFEGIKYLLCSHEYLNKHKNAINKINERYNFHIIEEKEDLIDRIIQDYNF